MSMRRGACPSLHEPMPTGDGLLVRLSPAGAGWAPRQLVALARAAARFGNGIVEVTTRGNLQIRGLREDSAVALAGHVEDAAIPLRAGLPIDVGPLAGIDAAEIADPQPLASRLRETVEQAGLVARLGPKVSVVIDGGGALTMDAVVADVRLTADPRSSGQWIIAVGGNARTARALGSVDSADAVPAAILLLEAIAARGKSVRARELSQDQLAVVLNSPFLRRRYAAPPLLPSWGERTSDRPRSRPLHLQGGEVPSEARWIGDLPVGRFALKDGGFAGGFALPFGQVEAETLAAFCAAVEDSGASEIRPARARGLIVPGLNAATCSQLAETALELGLVTDAGDPRLSIATCAGAPFCASGHLATRVLAATIAASAPELLAGRDLHISGCEKRCAEPSSPDLTVLGTQAGCLVLPRDGREAAANASVVTRNELAVLKKLAELVRGHEMRPARIAQPTDN